MDDTVLNRRLLTEVVDSLGNAEVVATATGGEVALAKLDKLPVDLVLLGLGMPGLDGLETLRRIRQRHPGLSVIVTGGAQENAAGISALALELGALDYIQQPRNADAGANREEFREKLLSPFRLARIRRNLHGPDAEPPPIVVPCPSPKPPPSCRPDLLSAPALPRTPRPTRIDVVAIGVSTGGPDALMELIPMLPADLAAPVLIVQHMPPSFTASLAECLAGKSQIAVREAVEGEPILAGAVLIAPGGRHMVVRARVDAATGQPERIVGSNDAPPENSCRPSVDVLFRSVATHYAGNILAVVMTGMGSDGCEGVRAMKRQGCLCLTQSEDSCVIYGMPMAVDEAGLSDQRVPLRLLASQIIRAVKGDLAPWMEE